MDEDWLDIPALIRAFEREGRVTRTFRRLDPDRQEAIIHAIFDEAVENGPEDLNIKRVAARANVAVGSLYQYFGSREGLLDFAIELATRITQAGFEQYRTALADLPLREALTAYGLGGMDWASSSAGMVRFFARAAYGGDPQLAGRVVRPIADAMLGMVRDILSAAQRRGELREDIDLDGTTRAVHALMIALYDPLLLPYLNAYFQIGGPDTPPERTLAAALNMILKGIEK